MGCSVFVVELSELFVYFGNYALVSCIICKYFLPVYRLSFNSVYSFLAIQKRVNLVTPSLFIFVFIYITFIMYYLLLHLLYITFIYIYITEIDLISCDKP